MPADITLDDIWKLFRETERHMREVSDRTDRKIAEVAEQLARTDAQLAATAAQLAKTDAHLARTDAQLAKTDALVARVTRAVDDLTGKWGKFVEGIVAPACETLFAERGIPVHRVYQRARSRLQSRTMEVDLLVVNARYVVLVEVKSTLKVEDVREHLDRPSEFKTLFPEYADRQVLGAVAGIVIEAGVDKFSYRQGLFVIAQSGDGVRLVNDGAFVPRAW